MNTTVTFFYEEIIHTCTRFFKERCLSLFRSNSPVSATHTFNLPITDAFWQEVQQNDWRKSKESPFFSNKYLKLCIWQSLNTMFMSLSLNIIINVFILSDEYNDQIGTQQQSIHWQRSILLVMGDHCVRDCRFVCRRTANWRPIAITLWHVHSTTQVRHFRSTYVYLVYSMMPLRLMVGHDCK